MFRIDLSQVVSKYTGETENVSRLCALEVLADQFRSVSLKRLGDAILCEYIKQGKVL